MEEWHVQASDRAESVVIAKVSQIYTILLEFILKTQSAGFLKQNFR